LADAMTLQTTVDLLDRSSCVRERRRPAPFPDGRNDVNDASMLDTANR
jgi:hypothetical protein